MLKQFCVLVLVLLISYPSHPQTAEKKSGTQTTAHSKKSAKKLQKFGAENQKSSKLEQQELKIDVAPTSKPYLILLINSTDHVVRIVRINGGPWGPTQLIGRTCDSTNYDYCYQNQKWAQLVSVNCGTTVQVDVAWNENNQWSGARWQPFYADCNYEGGVIQLVP